MIYYTIYVKRLNNGVGYIDVGLEDDRLLKDFEQYLDIGVRPHRSYKLAHVGTSDGGGLFTIDMAEVTAITTIYKDKAGEKLKSHTDLKKKHDTGPHTRHTTR